MSDMELQEVDVFSLLGFGLPCSFLIILPSLLFQSVVFTLCHCTLELCKLCFDIIGTHRRS